MLRIIQTAAVLLMFVACGHGEPVTVSQGQMNMAMLGRIKDEGASLCARDDGLKGVEWGYSTAPQGPIISLELPPASRKAGALNTPPPGNMGPALTTREMDRLASQAPRPYVNDFAPDEDALPEPPKYTCQDGAQFVSNTFRLIP
jgi:hypothetical protein